jgi:hypothetical protein
MNVFLLSPAWCGGKRAKILLNPAASFDLAVRLREGTLTLGEAFAFMSGLYFRGKLAYGSRFGPATAGRERTLVITPTQGLRPPSSIVTASQLLEFAAVDVHSEDPRYRVPLERDLEALDRMLERDTRVVLLGSIATSKYVDALSRIVGPRLCFPPSFVGRGDMSRGGLLLRAARDGVELDYAPLDATTKRHGARPPKLESVRVTPVVTLRLDRRTRSDAHAIGSTPSISDHVASRRQRGHDEA